MTDEEIGELWKLQWGRDREVADRLRTPVMRSTLISLQWGRDREVADRPTMRFIDKLRKGFNGAATVRSRIVLESVVSPKFHLQLQWGRDREVADSPPSQTGSLASRECFNGAATVRSRIEARAKITAADVFPASMGPRP